MKVTLTIECDNAAFEGADCGAEISRILKEAARSAHGYSLHQLDGLDGLILRDYNGNSVGTVEVSE